MKKILLAFFCLVFVTACRDKKPENATPIPDKLIKKKHTAVVKKDFLNELKELSVEYTGIFRNYDELFTDGGSWLYFVLIPKTGAQKYYELHRKGLTGAPFERDNAMAAEVSKIDKANLGKKFNIYVFYIDKKYTERSGLDSPFTIRTPRVVELYKLISGTDSWEKIDSFDVKDESYAIKENDWRDGFIDKMANLSNRTQE